MAYIEERATAPEPFFLYLTPSSPHEPCLEEVVPEFARGRSQAGPRGDMVWLVDWLVGQVLAALDRTGQAKNTLVIVTSDNGALPGDRKRNPSAEDTVENLYYTYGHKSCGDWRGYKAHIWEGGHREPLIMRWPGHIQPGSTSHDLVCLTDLMATCAAMLDVALPDDAAEDSVNVYPILTGQPVDSPLRTDLIHHSSMGAFSIRKGAWKCIFGTQGSGGWPPPRDGAPVAGAPGQLYNLDDDPAEQTNLWDAHQDVVAELADLLEAYQAQGRSVPHRSAAPTPHASATDILNKTGRT